MATDAWTKYPEKVQSPNGVRTDVEAAEEKAASKRRLVKKLIYLPWLGATLIVIADGVSRFAQDPLWALTCIGFGIPIVLLGIYELRRKDNREKAV